MVENTMQNKARPATALECPQDQTATQNDEAQRMFEEFVYAEAYGLEPNGKRDEGAGALMDTATTVEQSYQHCKKTVLADFARWSRELVGSGWQAEVRGVRMLVVIHA
eukprot:7627180-Pyramimonas_sp.AAC.1